MFDWRTFTLALIGALLALVVSFGMVTEHAAAPTESVPAVVSKSATSTPSVATSTPATATSTPAKKPVTQKPKPAPAPTPTPTPSVTVSQPPQTASSGDLNDTVRNAVVNIICLTEGDAAFHSISASGVMISTNGVILTNSHVAQYFLLKDYPAKDFTDCVIRTGSPARNAYRAELLFIPPSWIAANAQKITLSTPTGNGEHDYALLRITGTTNPNGTLPATFPSLAYSLGEPQTGVQTILAGYPAGFLGGITIAKDLYETSSLSSIKELYTYGTDTPDLFSIGGTVVAQQGASGGAVADQSGNLMGLIVTSTDAPDTASRDLRALSTRYIADDFLKESGTSLPDFLSGDVAAKARQFALGTFPTLRQELVNAIEGH